MITSFGKFCRKLRIDNGEIMLNMAKKLGVSAAFLSAVENGKKIVPAEWGEKIEKLYGLSDEAANELFSSIAQSRNEVTIEYNSVSVLDQQLAIAFAREFKSLDNDDKNKIMQMLNKNKKG